MKPLPPGLDPVQAGRFGLWLLGQREHNRALERDITAVRVWDSRDEGRLAYMGASAILPWRVNRYPALHKGLADILGVSVRVARGYLWERSRFPVMHALRLADFLAADIARKQEAERALRAYAAEKEASRKAREKKRGG